MEKSNRFNNSSKLFEVSDNNILTFQGTSKGNQAKWSIGDYWIKRDYLGYESLSEVITSKFLECVDGIDFVKYDFCSIKYNNVIYKDACCSRDFLEHGESLITFGRLLNVDNSFMKSLLKVDGKSRVRFIIDSIESKTGLNTTNYVGRQIYLDSIIKNEDRHLFNLALLEDCNGKFRECPVFDNGGSLLSDTRQYNLDTPLFINLRTVKSKPFNTDFKKQAQLFKGLNVPPLKIDLDKLNSKLSEITYVDDRVLFRALNTLKLGLKEMEGLSWEKV